MVVEGTFQVATTPNTLPLANNLIPGCVKASDDSFLPSYDEPLGVWNVEELPTLYSVDLLNIDTCRNELLLEDIRQYGRKIQ